VNSKLEEGDTISMDLDEKKDQLTIKISKPKKSSKA
jgi:ATP-dependent Clp protease ATP-binding subunit ClpC